ncbi:MAG: hypothetical protein AAF988_05840 [Pseudomonadota bacterium]
MGLVVLNFYETNIIQLIAGLLFASCSVSLILSAKQHRWLFYSGFALLVAYVLVSFSGNNESHVLQKFGSIAGIIGGSLTLRAAFQRETGKQFNLPYPFNLIDKYPLASAGLLEGSFCLIMVIGAFLSFDIRLGIIASIWVIAHSCLFLSDEYVRERLKF